MTIGPYAQAAWDYWHAGWRGILPLPQGAKWPPPAGFTGADGIWCSGPDVQEWIDGPEGAGNIALRLPPNIIGLDVDNYEGKEGLAALGKLEAEYGPLPTGGPMSGARTMGGIYYFSVPDGLRWPGDLGDAIEIIQMRHRYSVVWPSVHPSGAMYRWNPEVIPRPEDIPELPESWVMGITKGHAAQDIAKANIGTSELSEWIQLQGQDNPCLAVFRAVTRAQETLDTVKGSRHDVMTRTVMRLVRLSTEGHLGATTALGWLNGTWTKVAGNPPSARTPVAAQAEWARALEGAVAVALALPSRIRPMDPCDHPLAGILTPSALARGTSGAEVAPGGDGPPQKAPRGTEDVPDHRRAVLTPASRIQPRKVHWLWDGRIALGTLALLAGREGLGKSTLGLWMAAAITRGELPGAYFGRPKSVLVSATEDSWAHTLVPRLMAARADLGRVYQIRIEDAEGLEQSLVLPVDLSEVENAARAVNSAMWVLDPLMSRLEGHLDTHRDGDVRRALEPLTALADRTAMGLLGLIHFNKSGGSDPTNVIMGSRAFTAVARSVLTVIPHVGDDQERQRILGLAKNNLGPTNIPLEIFEIVSQEIETNEGPATTGRLEWRGVIEGSVGEAMEASAGDAEDRSSTRESAEWLQGFLADRGGEADRGDVWKAARAEGLSESTLKRARRLAGVESVSIKGVYPRRTVWRLGSRARGGSSSAEPTGLNAGHSVRPTFTVGSVGPWVQAPTRGGPTRACDCPNGAHGVHRDACRG